MAKNTKKVTVEVSANQVAAQPMGPDHYQTRQDAEDLMRVGMIRADKARHKRAVDALRCAVDHEDRGTGKGMKSRSGRRTAARNIGKR